MTHSDPWAHLCLLDRQQRVNRDATPRIDIVLHGERPDPEFLGVELEWAILGRFRSRKIV